MGIIVKNRVFTLGTINPVETPRISALSVREISSNDENQ